ncbi:MAG: metalloregulator ArsR/SmtB family transcription factor [Clostridia bacterium]|nr:metalloregulator ArsR/SmtB family transcription factor [Clostridia bacterium]
MENKYVQNANLFKALSDPNRLMILEMLSDGELCACKILDALDITQPTLSHHMKILCDCGLVNATREGKWMHYSIEAENIQKLKMLLNDIIEGCSCKGVCLCK